MEEKFTSQESEDEYYKALLEAGLKEFSAMEKRVDEHAGKSALERLEKTVARQGRELRDLSMLVRRLADGQKYAAEREAYERKLLRQEIEIRLLKEKLQIPSPVTTSTGNDESQK